MKEFANREIVTQMISPPQVVSLNLQEDLLLKTHMELFQRFGFEISEFGGREYSIHGVPANLYGVSVQDFFVELLDSLEMKIPDSLWIFSPGVLQQQRARLR